MNTSQSKTPKIVGAILGLAVIGAGLAWAFGSGRTPEQPENVQAPEEEVVPSEEPTTDTTGPASGSVYRDGTYSANGAYTSPNGAETVSVSLTLKGDAVTAATFTGNGTNPTTRFYQQKFSEGYKAQVVGKDLASLSLGAVNGSSLTPIGFMDAVAKIKAEAQG